MLFDNVSAATTSESSRSATDSRKLEGDLNRFLTLLVTQLQNQDPLEPLDANEFTSQLVQFASVEQQIYQNANLEKLLTAQQGDQTAALMAYLDKEVEAAGGRLPLQEGTARGAYLLPERARETTIEIRDAGGRLVNVLNGATAAGRHEFVWDGKGADGQQLPDGTYAFAVAATNVAGQSMTATQHYFGRVTGVSAGEEGSLLRLDDSPLALADVITVREPPLRPVVQASTTAAE